ncbi:MAG: hypothetical protein WD673_06215 [Alphaproteobacteria bacterium]
MSWVFLTDRYAYKLKKPVRYPFLDFATPEARARNCNEELRLNRRLAPTVYLSVVPMVLRKEGDLSLGDDGTPVDWLVKMRRLPDDRRLDIAIMNQTLVESDVRRLAERLAAFYGGLSPISIHTDAYRHRFIDEIDVVRKVLIRPSYRQDRHAIGRLSKALHGYLRRHADFLDRRVLDNRIVEGHGDLRPEHIYLGNEILVTDCLEFNRDLRIVDPVDELAYLAMECERLGAPLVRTWLFETYSARAGDSAPRNLIYFYACFRACLRARIALAHLDEPSVAEPARWVERGRRYLEVGLHHADGLGRTPCKPP